MFQFLAVTQAGCHQSFPPHLLHRIAALAISAVVGLVAQAIDAQPVYAAQASRPNIVLIMADDMGYECVGANGSTFYQTPHLDRLAAGGLRFEHAYSQPICTPSRVQLMTGRYNARNYVRFGLLHSGEITFANVLKKAGYRTCIAGKWQLQGGMDGPRGFGFDEYCLWQLTRRPPRYANPGLEINGREVDYKDGQYGPDLVSDYLVDFIQRNREGPFFAYYPMILPHWPFQPTPDSKDWDPAETKEWPRKKWDRPHFREMVAYADKLVGKVDRALSDCGIRENTLLIFTCDNGTYTEIASPFRGGTVKGGKGTTPNAGTHVPLIASWPGTIQPGVSQDLIDFSDVLPTLADAGKGELPRDRELDGRSFLPQLLGQPGNPRDWVFCWYERNGKRDTDKVQRFARNQTYKLYHDGRFYDVPSDELEKQGLSPDQLDSQTSAVRSRLQAVLDRMADAEKKYPYARSK